ncbi:MAG: hypothetical protein JXA53_07090 [Bacteroidales bacterium]|nr:hypothetical protein [Bacteroidales bacterium]
MKSTINIMLILSAIIISISSCNNASNEERMFAEARDSVNYDGELPVAKEVVSDMIQNVTSPIEMASLIKALNMPFSKNYLAPTDNLEKYVTNFEQALALGIYGADLGYINMYEKTSSVLAYISAMKDLANELKIGQFFDFNTLKDLATNSENIDSLVYISQRSFTKMDNYLRESQRSKLSSLMVTGVWIEGVCIASNVALKSNNEEVAEKIGDQKVILKTLLIILENYKKDTKVIDLVNKLKELEVFFDQVKISTIPGEPEMKEVNGSLCVIQNDITTVEISPETLSSIINKSIAIRNSIINQ